MILFYLVSFFSFLFSPLNYLMFFGLLLFFTVISIYKLEYGALLIVSEIFINSFGRIFYADLGDGTLVSLRISMFVVFMGVFLYKEALLFLKNKKEFLEDWQKFYKNKLFLSLIVLLIYFFILFLTGIYKNGFERAFLDFNGYFVFLYLFPFYRVLKLSTTDTHKKFLSILVSGTCFIVFKTYFLLWIFSHNIYGIMEDVYKWTRDYGFGEITFITDGFYRIFMQNQIYAVIMFFVFITYLWQRFYEKKSAFSVFRDRSIVYYSILSGAVLSVVFISLSRSFWLGFGASSIAFVFYIWQRRGIRDLFRFSVLPVTTLVLATLFTLAVLYVPPIKQKIDLAETVEKRASVYEPAGSSRINLLPPLWSEIKSSPFFGYGFGKTVTYKSADPRVVLSTAGMSGEYTTFAFEWTYLDIWLKAGAVGLAVYLYVLFLIFRWNYLYTKNSFIKMSVYLSLMSFVFINITTPYINHPLGIIYLLSLIFIISYQKTTHTAQ